MKNRGFIAMIAVLISFLALGSIQVAKADVSSPNFWKVVSSNLSPIISTWTVFFTNGFVSQSSSTINSTLVVTGNINSSSTLTANNVTVLGTCTGCGGGGTSGGGNGFFSPTSSFYKGPVSVTDGSTTSSLQAAALFIATSTANQLGVFNIDSSGNTSVSGTEKVFGIGTFGSGLIANSSSSVNYFQVANALNASSSLFVNSGIFLKQDTTNRSGLFNVDSSGNVNASGTIFAGSTFRSQGTTANYYNSNASADGLTIVNAQLQFKIAGNQIVNLSSTVVAPQSNNTVGLGNFGNAYSGVYTSGTSFAGNFTLGPTAGLTSFLSGNNLQIGISGTNPIGYFFVDGSGNLFTSSSIMVAQQSGKNLGTFYIDTSGNVSTSGTLKEVGLGTFLGGLISNASSSIAAGLQVAGNLSVSSTATFASTLDASAATVIQNVYRTFTYQTSTAWTGTSTIQLGTTFPKETWKQVQCQTDAGTLNVQFINGASSQLNILNASNTVGVFNFSTNNAFSANTKRSVQIGTPASSPTTITCSANIMQNQ